MLKSVPMYYQHGFNPLNDEGKQHYDDHYLNCNWIILIPAPPTYALAIQHESREKPDSIVVRNAFVFLSQ